jgi:hypothetical protein
MQFDGTTKFHRKSGSVYTNCETARADPDLLPYKIHPSFPLLLRNGSTADPGLFYFHLHSMAKKIGLEDRYAYSGDRLGLWRCVIKAQSDLKAFRS